MTLAPAHVERTILLLRGERVMLDADLAVLYGVETRVLVQAVKRNAARFPPDFMFQLTAEEVSILKSQTVISSAAHGGRRKPLHAFTEHGVAMLSAVLRSPRAIQVSIEIIRTFVRLRCRPGRQRRPGPEPDVVGSARRAELGGAPLRGGHQVRPSTEPATEGGRRLAR